jgi:hypothetical protein
MVRSMLRCTPTNAIAGRPWGHADGPAEVTGHQMVAAMDPVEVDGAIPGLAVQDVRL